MVVGMLLAFHKEVDKRQAFLVVDNFHMVVGMLLAFLVVDMFHMVVASQTVLVVA